MATFSTSQECYEFITGTEQTVGSRTRPAEGALDLYRAMVYSKLQIIGTTDSAEIMKTIEMEMVASIWEARQNHLIANIELTEDQKTRLQMEIGGTLPGGTYEPNKDGAISG